MKNKEFCSKDLAITLHKLGFGKPSKYYYEWTGAIEIEEATGYAWFEDSINVYTARQLKNAMPTNVAVNENVVEFGIKKNDTEVDKIAKVLIWLLKNNLLNYKYGRIPTKGN